MASPFIIWTLQRTGGTSLSDILSELTGMQPILQEPFNRGRDLETVATLCRQGDLVAAASRIDDIFNQSVCIKHCFELHSKELNAMLIERLAKHSEYRHILLNRKSEAERICSLYLAKQTSVWGKWKVRKGGYEDIIKGKKKLEPFPVEEMIRHKAHCADYWKWLVDSFESLGLESLELNFEELYEGPAEERIETLQNVLSYISAKYHSIPEVERRIISGGQGSEKIYSYVPNFDQAIESISSA